MGLSSILEGGHVIYLPKDGEDTERFFHTCHVRPPPDHQKLCYMQMNHPVRGDELQKRLHQITSR